MKILKGYKRVKEGLTDLFDLAYSPENRTWHLCPNGCVVKTLHYVIRDFREKVDRIYTDSHGNFTISRRLKKKSVSVK
jgi:hypothetical protein